jgi:hypothetical protein
MYAITPSYPCGSSATIKQRTSTPVFHPLVVMVPKYMLVPHRAHNFIVNVRLSFPTTVARVSVWVENVDRIVPAACGPAVAVKHATELVVRRLRRFPSNRCHDFWIDHEGFLALASMGEIKEKIIP